MDINELNRLFYGENFFYYSDYIGVIERISYDYISNSYLVYTFGCKFPVIIQYNFMLNLYINKLKYLRMLILKNRNIQSLVHFTPISNLESIFKDGLLSRHILNVLSYNYSYSDDVRLDNKLDYISNSITFPNYKMFYSKRMEDTNVKWAVLSIDSEILINKLDTEFYRMNAASSDISKCRFNPCSNEALEDMFYSEGREPNLPINYTTNPQAEVMVKDGIDSSYIKRIDTCGFYEKVKWLAYNSHIDYNSQSDLFSPREDYKRW